MDPPATDGIREPLQYVHVELQGGAPWGFTLQGGLEHRGPLIISKIEDGGKAAKCEKIEVGDELVNINGTPLHGSRQEALILIKGSYKILKMIVRRRSVLLIRPHSWHVAKLSEVHPDVASMQCPSNAFSLSWHSGSEICEHPLQWNILSRHCSTDKSSSIGSMESLDQPGQNYYEGTRSPLDPAMYQNKRDSAYSSFSTNSNISDYTLSATVDESSPANCSLGSNKQEDGRYLQTGQGAVDSQVDVSGQSLNGHFQKMSVYPCDAHNLDNVNSPPQPPIRRDSLRENKNQFCNRDRRASDPSDSFDKPGIWSSEAGQFSSSENDFCHCTNRPCTVHLKENLSSDQYYMLSSKNDKIYQINTFAKDDERQPNHCNEQKDCHYPKDKCKENEKRYKFCANNDSEISQHQSTEQPSDMSGVHLFSSSDISARVANEAMDAPSSQFTVNMLTQDASGQEEKVGPKKKPGSSRHRSAQMRRKSDRFATNLRNEIQRRKAQLQKSKDSIVPLSGEDSVEENDNAFEIHSELIPHHHPPPPPPPKNKALLLEIKRINAERCSDANSNQKKLESELIDNNNETTSKENIPSIKEHSRLLVPSLNKTYNEWWKSNALDTQPQESLFKRKSEIDHQNPEQDFSYSTRDFQQATYMAPKPESFLNEWAPFSTSKSSSPNIWKTEDEISIGTVKIPVECRDSSGIEQKQIAEVCSADTLKNSCDNQPPAETLDKHNYVDMTGCINNPKISCHTNLGQEKKIHEAEFSSAAHLASQQQFSEVNNHLAQYNQNSGAKCTWSPDHKLQTAPSIGQHFGQKLTGMNVEEIVSPISRISTENILMPFADRRKFFEDVSKRPSTVNDKQNKNFRPIIPDNLPPQTMASDLRRHSADHTYYTASPKRKDSGLPHYDYCMDHRVNPPMCCSQEKHCTHYLSSLTYGYRACVFCANELCPALLKRNTPVTHHICHCQHLHQHHHHPWTKCSDYMCPTQYNLLEDSGPLHVDQWHMRKPTLQDTSMKEWSQQQKINRKCSQSVSDLCCFPYGIQHPGLLNPCCEQDNYERSQSYKTTSSYDLSCEKPLRPGDFASFQDGHPKPSLPQLSFSRNRAYSVSHLNLEYLALQDRIESPTTILEERAPLARSKKQGPPRPPPPKWEKYKEHQASKEAAKSGLYKERSVSELNRDIEDARHNSQSLVVDRTSLNVECNLFPPINGINHVKEPSEIRCASQGPQKYSPAPSPSQIASSNTSECKESDGDDQLFCSESSQWNHCLQLSMKHASLLLWKTYLKVVLDVRKMIWSTDRESEISIPERYDEFQPISPTPFCGTDSPTTCATYYNTSTAKADLLNRMKEVSEAQGKDVNVTDAEYEEVQLIDSISRKLSVLHKAQQELQEDISANATLGCELENLLKSVCKPNEYDKFRIFIGDLDKVVSLLLSLSGRLSRVESALNCKDPKPSMEEKLNLLEKRKQLIDQLEDAKELKAHVTRREKIVLATVSKYLNDEQLQDYHHYVKMTSALIVEQRELEDKIRLGEEQLACLRESLQSNWQSNEVA
ncbi:protein Shroom4 isoform X1 [Bufo bufo]|uniref:protein Shroom4 isoform X1 n=3 Tax=Bufo bufo TaxID=8384 RepID=UPI001ABDBA05|nr:protein Shroom4 isoform X1 [Bufo bufo]